MSLEVPDVEDKFQSPTGTYDQLDVTYPDADTAPNEATGSSANKTREIAGPPRRKVVPIAFKGMAATQLNALIASYGRLLFGWSMTETAGAVAVWIIHGSMDISTRRDIARVSLAANGRDHDFYPDGIDIEDGLAFERVSGTVDVTLYIGHE